MLIVSTPIEERPRERCLNHGSSCLSLRECLALLIGTGPRGVGCLGLAERILSYPGIGLAPEEEERALFLALESSGDGLLSQIEGLNEAARTRLLATFELARRYARFREQTQRLAPSRNLELPALAIEALQKIPSSLRSETREWFGFIPCYPGRKVGNFSFVEQGVRTHVNVDPVELFARLLALRPGGFFLAHNHPSGDLRVSPQDLELTERVQELARKFEIELLGHWVVSAHSQKWMGAIYHAS